MNPSRMRILLFALLFAAWMLPGVVGRDPWKADEAYTVGLVLNIVETGDWVVPTLGADPFMEKPPVFFITSALFARLLSPPLSFHVAARAACVFYLLVTLWCVALASRELNGRDTGWVAAILMLGCVGLVHQAHLLMTDNSLLTGFALVLYGLSLQPRAPWRAGLLCGTGSGLTFLSKGFLGPCMIGLLLVSLPVFCKAWRNRSYWRVLGGSVAGALPWMLIWPLALYHRSPELFTTWFWNNNVERFLGVGLGASDTNSLHYLKMLPGLAWPALPLAIWTLWREGRDGWRNEKVQLPLLAFLTMLLVLSAAGQRRANYATPLILPLVLLGTRAVDAFTPRFVKLANRAGFAFFTVLAAVAWFGWLAQFTDFPPQVLARIRAQVPDFASEFHVWAFAVALLASVGWLWLLLRHRPENGMVVAHWTAGVALLYLLGMTLWLPVTNQNMSYRRDFAGLREALGANPGMVAARGVGEPQRAMLHYFAGVRVACEEMRGPQEARWLLIQGATEEKRRPQPPDASWQLAWQGTHHRELFQLYRRGS
jgi:4-amino-4-deoxy-L-arabinose transferase-like glycosyltransferase